MINLTRAFSVLIKYLAENARRHGRYRINVEHRVSGRSDDLISHTDQALIAAAQERADGGNLAEHVAKSMQRDEAAAHLQLVARIIDAALDHRTNGRSLHHAFPDRELASLLGEIRAQMGEVDPVRRPTRTGRDELIELGLVLDREIRNIDAAISGA